MPLNPNYSGVRQNIQITEVSGLQSAIDTVQTNIENETTDRLNSDVNISNSLQALEITVNTKQTIINDGDLSISKVSGLQSAIDTVQTNIENETTDRLNSDVNISNSLQALAITVDTKQTIINDGDLSISKVSGLQSAIDTKQTIIGDGDLSISKVSGLQTALDLVQTTTTNSVDDLQTQIIDLGNTLGTSTENVQSRITTEIDDRTNADTDLQNQINLKLAESNSIHRENYAFYCVDGRNDLHSVLPNVNNQGAYISISSGSFGNLTPLTIDQNNLSMFSVPSTPPICEFACPITIASTANRIRMRYMSFDGVCNLNGKRCVYTHSTFNNSVNIGSGTTEYMTFANCEFSAGKTITFSATMASVVYIIECNIAGANLVFNNASPLQVIFSNCSGFVNLPTTAQATLIGLNVKADGTVVQHNISKIVLPTGEGLNNQVLTSTGSGNCVWTTPSGGGGGGGGGSSILKEYFSRYCLGQSVSTSSGNIILENITTEQSITNTIYNSNTVYINGSTISYIPPANSSIVEYEFSFYCYSEGANDNVLQLEFHIDGITQTPTRQKILLNGSSVGPANNKGQMLYTFKTLIEINGIADNADKCSLNTWDTSKTLNLKIAKWGGTTNLWLHKHDNYFSSTGFVTTIIPPTLTIKAY